MKTVAWLVAWLGLTMACFAQASEPSAGKVIRLDPAFDALVPAGAIVEKVADGFQFIEGPVWQSGRLLFSDIPANTVYSWSAADGMRTFLHPVGLEALKTGGEGGSNGLALDPLGRLILCEHGNRRIARLESDGTRTSIAERYHGGRLNSPNDIVFHASGAAFFTDPPYGLAGQDESPQKEQPHNGIYRLDPDGSVTLLEMGQTRPNGIGLSVDGRTLYVANSDGPPNRYWKAYPVMNDLSLGDGRIFFDASGMAEPGAPDGLTLDRSGNLFATGPGGVLVFDPAGKHLGTIAPAELPANAGWGDDGRTLYMTARTGLYRIRLSTEGLVFRGD